MLAPATTKVQTPLPPIEINLYTTGDVIPVLAACVGQAPDRVEPRRALHSTALALGLIARKSDVWPRELLTVRRGDLPGGAPGGHAGWSRALSSRQRDRLQELASD
jgi:hypothetical protein